MNINLQQLLADNQYYKIYCYPRIKMLNTAEDFFLTKERLSKFPVIFKWRYHLKCSSINLVRKCAIFKEISEKSQGIIIQIKN